MSLGRGGPVISSPARDAERLPRRIRLHPDEAGCRARAGVIAIVVYSTPLDVLQQRVQPLRLRVGADVR